ncbi:MAG: C39 family peptidase [Ruminococcus sp.]|nr:C39 family peptidase [Ruminococcus sp.]
MRKRTRNRLVIVGAGVLIILALLFTVIVSCNSCTTHPQPVEAPTAESTEPQTTKPEKYIIDENVKVIEQTDLKAGCETYACTMLFNMLGFDLDEHTIADNYLNCQFVFGGDEEGDQKYGPDMYSAFAGTAYSGWGVYAPSMAKSMNKYLQDQKSKLKAYNMEKVPLETLIDDYVSKGVPVMVWATTDMDEPYVYDTWIVNYVDENARTKIGDTFSWYMHEHCLVLIGYDKDNYYFADSTAGKISVFNKELVKKRYEQMGEQSIVVK